MPLLSGRSDKVIAANIQELNSGEIGAARRKAIKTYAKKHGLSFDDARQHLSEAIAMGMAKRKRVKMDHIGSL